TRRIIAHGRRIRAVLQQPELQPVPIAEQLVLLLALNKGLFDAVPLIQMTEAEHLVRAIVALLPLEVQNELSTADLVDGQSQLLILRIAEKSIESLKDSTP